MKKKVLALVLALVMTLSLLPVTAMANEPTQQIFWGFEEITSVDQMEIGKNYIFFTEAYDTNAVVTGLPDGSAILNYGGTDYTLTDNFAISPFIMEGYAYMEEVLVDETTWDALMSEERIDYEEIRSYAEEEFEYAYGSAPTEEELDTFLWKMLSEAVYDMLYYEDDHDYEIYYAFMEFTSLEDYNAWAADYSSDAIQFQSLEAICDYINSVRCPSAADIKEKYGKATWEETIKAYITDLAQEEHKYELLEGFGEDGSCSQDERDGYVTVMQAGPGFDECYYGTIAYIDYYGETGWYYGCNWGGVCNVGPFYAYTYNEGEFKTDDIAAFYKPGKEPTAATTVTLDDIDVTVNVNGASVSVGEGFVEFIDATVDPTQNDNSITLSVGGIEKTIGEIGAPPVTYNVTVNNGSGDGSFAAGRMVVITADAPADGMVFDKWTGNVTFDDATASTTSFVMPEGDVTVTATYRMEGSDGPTPPPSSDKIVDTVNLTVDWDKVPVLIVGEPGPEFRPSNPDGGDYLVVNCDGVSEYFYGWLRERTEEEGTSGTKWIALSPNDVIANDVKYALGVEFPLDEGYAFADTVTVKINAGLVATIDYVSEGNPEFDEPTMMGITIALGTLEDIEDAKDDSQEHSHEMTKTPAKDATCTADGNIEYYTCSGCEKLFADEKGEKELKAEDLVVKSEGHKVEKIAAKAPTYIADGNKEYYHCNACDTAFADAEGKKALTASEIKDLVIPQLILVAEDKAEVSEGAVDKALSETKKDENVTLDLTHKNVIGEENVGAVTKVELPVAALETMIEEEKALTLVKENAVVTLDTKALEAVVEQAAGNTVTLVVKDVETTSLKPAQQAAVESKKVAATISAELICDQTGKKIATKDGKGFGGGAVTVSIPVPAKLPEGVEAADLKVYFVDDDGTVEHLSSKLDGNKIVFTLKHFSEYVIAADAPVVPSAPATGDSTNVAMYITMAVISAAATVLLIAFEKKAKARYF